MWKDWSSWPQYNEQDFEKMWKTRHPPIWNPTKRAYKIKFSKNQFCRISKNGDSRPILIIVYFWCCWCLWSGLSSFILILLITLWQLKFVSGLSIISKIYDKGSKKTHKCSSFMCFQYSRKERDFMTIPPLSPFSPAKSSALIQSFSCGWHKIFVRTAAAH